MNKNLKHIFKFLLFLSIGVGILYLLYTNQNEAYQAQCELDGIPLEECSLMDKLVTDFTSSNFFWILMVLVVFTISNISRAMRWNMLLHPLGYRPRLSNSFLIVVMAYFINLFLPRAGELARAGLISRYENVPVEKAMGTIVLDRLLDVLMLLLIVGLTFLLEFDTLVNYLTEKMVDDPEKGSLFENPIIIGLGVAGVIGVLLLFLFRKKLEQTSIYQKIKKLLIGFAEGLKTIGKLENVGLFIFHTILIWVMYFLMTYLCFFAYAPTAGLGPLPALMVFVFGTFGIVVPSPGGMGTFHFFATEALKIYGVDPADAFSFANILFFSVQIGCNVVIGLMAFILLPLMNRNYKPVVESKI